MILPPSSFRFLHRRERRRFAVCHRNFFARAWSAVVADSIWTVTGTGLLGLAVNGVLLLGSFWIARYGLSQPRGLAAVLATAVVFWTACTVGLETLGSFGAISVGPMLAWGGMFLGVGGVVRWLRAPVGRERPCERTAAVLSWDALVGLAGVFSAALFFGMRSLLLAVKVVSDGPIYHLYFAARWWKAGRLFLVAAPFGENAATYFPANGDLWFTWLMASWGGDRLAKVGQAPFLVLAGLAAFGCARGWERAARQAWSQPAGSSPRPPFCCTRFEPNVDTIFVAGYLVAAYFFLRVSSGRRRHAALFWEHWPRAKHWEPRPSVSSSFLRCLPWRSAGSWSKPAPADQDRRRPGDPLVPLVTGGYWFIRNGMLTGNPLYPLEIRWWGHTVWHGWYGPEAMRTSPYYLPLGIGGRWAISCWPSSTPGWYRSGSAHWSGLGSERPEDHGDEGLDRDLLAHGGAERRDLLGLHSLSDAAAIHAPGTRPGSRPARR